MRSRPFYVVDPTDCPHDHAGCGCPGSDWTNPDELRGGDPSRSDIPRRRDSHPATYSPGVAPSGEPVRADRPRTGSSTPYPEDTAA